MANDLLTGINGEVHERLRALRPAVDECERLQADLRALEGEMETEHESIACELLSVPAAAPAPPVCAATRPRPLVSPKVMRLMGEPGAGPVAPGSPRRARMHA